MGLEMGLKGKKEIGPLKCRESPLWPTASWEKSGDRFWAWSPKKTVARWIPQSSSQNCGDSGAHLPSSTVEPVWRILSKSTGPTCRVLVPSFVTFTYPIQVKPQLSATLGLMRSPLDFTQLPANVVPADRSCGCSSSAPTTSEFGLDAAFLFMDIYVRKCGPLVACTKPSKLWLCRITSARDMRTDLTRIVRSWDSGTQHNRKIPPNCGW